MTIKETRDENGELHSFNDEPAVIWDNLDKFWCKNGELHRDNDQPAVIYHDDIEFWYQYGKRHRETDAAVIYPNGLKEYWLNGKQYTFKKWLKLTPISKEHKIAILLER